VSEECGAVYEGPKFPEHCGTRCQEVRGHEWLWRAVPLAGDGPAATGDECWCSCLHRKRHMKHPWSCKRCRSWHARREEAA
jgi:hypothetical protein